MPSHSEASGPSGSDSRRIHVNEPLKLPRVEWHTAPPNCVDQCSSPSGKQTIKIRYGTIIEGRGNGVQVVEIDNGPLQVTLLPTRGMSIWQIICDGVPFKWNSPIDGPVNPALVPVFDPSGLGWLEGFDEMMVRCGLVSNGAPEFDAESNWRFPLHGRIANLPAERIWCEADDNGIVLAGDVREQRLFFNNLQLTARIRIDFDSRVVEIDDTVKNLASTAMATQMLYHINIGKPVLDAGSRLVAAVKQMAPRDQRAAEMIDSWDIYDEATSGYSEVVNFFQMVADKDDQAEVLLESSAAETGMGVAWDTSTLPCFVQWKNTAADQDGFVTGLEPGTNFPNTKSFEAQQGRVVTLEPDGQVSYRVSLSPLVGRAAVGEYRSQVESLAAGVESVIHSQLQSFK